MTMKGADLRVGSVIEIRLNLSPEQINKPISVVVYKATAKNIWFKYCDYKYISRNTFDWYVENLGYRIISI